MALLDYSSRFSPSQAPSDSAGDDRRTFKVSKKTKLKSQYLLGALVLVLVLVGGGAAFFLSQTNQDVRQQAATSNPYTGFCGSTGQNGCFNGIRYLCVNGSWQNAGSCGSTTPLPTPTPTANVGCGSAGQRVPAGVTLNCAR